ncbi:MAG: cyclic nucleotide-binding domain-containing protein [Polyangiaceae bacterium]
MARPSTPDLLRPIDHALSRVAEDDPEGALRYALPLAERDPTGALELFVVGYALLLLDDKALGGRALKRASQAAIGESNLPLSLAAALILRRADSAASAASIAALSKAFGRGAATLGERRAAPPGLPGAGEETSVLDADVGRDALIERARKLLDGAAELSAIGPRSLSPQPLFSSLGADDLEAFAEIFQVRVYAAGARLVEEGSVGAEAFVVARGELDVEKGALNPDVVAVHLARLGAGALVGEMALLLRSPRAATVTVARPTVALVADKDALDAVAARAPQVAQKFAEHCKRRMVDNLVRTSPLFRAATPAERPALVERFGIRTFEPGEKLARQGSPSEGLFLLGSGEVSIVHREGEDKTLVTRLGPGDVVGEVATVLRRPAIADAVAQSPTVSLFLPRERFLELVRNHPKVFADLYEIAAKRDEEIESISQEEAAEGEDFVLV